LYLEGRWRSLRFRPELTAGQSAFGQPGRFPAPKARPGAIFGIDDPRVSEGIQFVGGIRGAAELEKYVNTKEYACAFSLHPAGIET